MKHFKLRLIYVILVTTVLFTSCTTDDSSEFLETTTTTLLINGALDVKSYHQDNQGSHKHVSKVQKTESFMETFETTSKGSYAGNAITINSGIWYLEDALIGSLANDRKYGAKSIRIRNNGYAVMNFNMDNGASTVRIRHAVYGTNGASDWNLMASYDDGVSWYTVGATVTTSSTTLNTVTFEVNDTVSVRYGIYKVSGGSSRINIDNIEIDAATLGSTGPEMDSNLTFGNPSNAASLADNYFLSKPDFSLSYNNSNGTPNWVSWHLSTAWTGSTVRCNCFKSDQDLPSTFFKTTTSDYTNSGFDRGHICPSADRNGDPDSNENTYYMTNIAPQAPDNNRRSWANFESYLRTLIDDDNEIHIIAGVTGIGGTGSNGYFATISNGEITVPDSFWKVALILPNGSNDISRVTTATRVIAINVPNDQYISTDWTQFITTVDSIELLTGYDILENIPDAIENVLEATADNGPIS
ncbi:DNA/RNA non-specific endonuclease [Cellulophaga fucicola]|uniref:DNA/RNA non-specific endonuclease n=1 Tax=Cellulophaga fucicola TaxID=76595 RepID=UPI003EBAE282